MTGGHVTKSSGQPSSDSRHPDGLRALPEWWNWQTHHLEGVALERAYRFKSGLRHKYHWRPARWVMGKMPMIPAGTTKSEIVLEKVPRIV